MTLLLFTILLGLAIGATAGQSETRMSIIDSTRALTAKERHDRCLPALRYQWSPGHAVPRNWRPWVVVKSRRELRTVLSAYSRCPNWAGLELHFHNALGFAARTFGVSYSWLHNCDHSEGSDRMVWNRAGSGAFGPMQFMHGTFVRMMGAALADLRARDPRLVPPAEYQRWDSNVGQALAAAWGFSHGRSHEWVGAGCR